MRYKAPYGSVDPDADYVDKDVPGAIAGSRVPRQAVEHPQKEIGNAIDFFLGDGSWASAQDPDELDQLKLSIAAAVRGGKWSYAADGGTANAMTVTLDPVPAAYVAGMVVNVLKSANANTGAVTLNVNGLGAQSVLDSRGNALVAGDLPASALLTMIHTGAAFRVLRTVAADLGQQKSVFNAQSLRTSTRVSMTGNSGNSYTVTPWTPANYVKKSATSDLLVWIAAPTLSVTNGPTTATLSVGGTDVSVVASNSTASNSNGSSVIVDKISGLSAGSKAVSLTYSRNDASNWTAVFCPITSDKAQLPASTTATIMIAEVEP